VINLDKVLQELYQC